MAISISLVLVFAVAVWLLYRYSGLKIWHALVSIAQRSASSATDSPQPSLTYAT